MKSYKKGFTLIELLVVIGIIGLLASILMPSLSKAREQAKGASCLSNLHNTGLSLAMYQSDERGFFPTSYAYIDGSSGSSGYHHWTAAIDKNEYQASISAKKYPKSAKQFVCPSHMPGGWAPTNFTTWRIGSPPAGQTSQDVTGTMDDKQAPRLSYVANEIVMPRKKFSAEHDRLALADPTHPAHTNSLSFVDGDRIEAPNNTILVGEFSQSANCIYGNSVAGGDAYKSHRPTNAVKSNQINSVFDGEKYITGTQVFKLTIAEAQAAIDAVLADRSVAAVNHHVSYIEPNAHKTGSNYLFVDGHSSRHTLEETLDQGNYMWGRKVYSCVDQPVIQDNP